jgi:glycoprotein endo-alpha-1,2-mannosidase
MRQLREAGVGVIAVSWYPPQHADQPANLKFPPDSLMPMLLDLAHQHGLEVTLHIEPYHGRNASTVRRDLVHLREEYGAHPALHRVAGRSLVYVYDSYHTPHEEWAQLLSPRGAMTIRGTPHDALVLGLCVGADDPKKLLAGAFDGFYTYFASRKFTYGSDWNHWGLLSRFAKRNGMIFVPSVGPGYDDTRVRPWNAQNIATRDRGGYYNKSWSAALESGAHLVSITSFNEWHEGTQIEAAARRTGYPDYGFGVSESAYLRLTRSWVQRMKLQQARSTA